MDETATNSLPVETQEQVNIIDQSKINIILIIAATILSYYATDLDKQQLICTVKTTKSAIAMPKVLPVRMLSSIMIISALLYFTNLTGNILEQPQDDPKQCRKTS